MDTTTADTMRQMIRTIEVEEERQESFHAQGLAHDASDAADYLGWLGDCAGLMREALRMPDRE